MRPLAQGQLVAGHLEERDASLHDGSDPDVSGTIALTGTACDNQRIESITVQIDAFDRRQRASAMRARGGCLDRGASSSPVTRAS